MLKKIQQKILLAAVVCIFNVPGLTTPAYAGNEIFDPTEMSVTGRNSEGKKEARVDQRSAAEGVSENFGTTPVLNNGKKWTIAFYEGGPTVNYYHYLEATVLGLMKLGWIEKADLNKVQGRSLDTRRLWNWLANKSESDYLEFLEDGYYTAN